MPFDSSLLGQPVEVGQITRELKNLWDSSSGVDTRASLVNFVVHASGVESVESNTHLISQFMREHACRAVLIVTTPDSPTAEVKAWINAHCHLSRAGAKQVCCEQITIQLAGAAERQLPTVLFANLDSDLPLYLWWQGELHEPLGDQILTWVDRLIFDSRDWRQPKEQFALLQQARKRSNSHMILCDLDWTRTLHLRQAVAQTFDHPENLAQIPKIKRLNVSHAPGYRSTALLFAAWIAVQLRWELKSRGGGRWTFRSAHQEEIVCELQSVPGAPIGACEAASDEASVSIQRDAGSPFYRADVRLSDGRAFQPLMPAGGDGIACLLDDELTFGGRHKVYLKTLAMAEKLF